MDNSSAIATGRKEIGTTKLVWLQHTVPALNQFIPASVAFEVFRAAVRISAAMTAVLMLLGCTVTQFTRYYVTPSDAGKTLRLHRGDEVTLNLPISGGRDWAAVSSDTRVARPTTNVVTIFSNGERARFVNFVLDRAGHTQLLACPAGSGDCTAIAAGALTFDVDVT